MLNLFSPARWRTHRDNAMLSARACRAALTDPTGHYRLAPDDQRVKDAVASWVAKARRAHAIALGREPVIRNMVVVDAEGAVSGAVYAGEVV